MTVALTLLATALLSWYFISDDWKYPNDSISPQLKHSIFVSIAPNVLHLYHSVMLWRFLDCLSVLGILCSSSNKLYLHLNSLIHTETLLKPFCRNNCYFFAVNLSYRYISENLWTELTESVVNKHIFQWGGIVLISYRDLCFHYEFHT